MEALSVMRDYNKAYKLPNPPTWYEIVAKSIKKAGVSFKKVLIPRKWEPSRVSIKGRVHRLSKSY